MHSAAFANTPQPPYYAVIFTSQRTDTEHQPYADMADAMVLLAEQQPGFLGAESTRGSDGLGITVSYWQTEEDIRRWKAQSDHLVAQRMGAERWYAHYQVRVAKVERAYGMQHASAT
ncbi:antibiotic biosynthesis monooxygenase family protein [Comamonas sp. MYb69]|uniref:antibiotic biosynthesis monooxygenase family protein n=1 Tax=Comamonas sp. MYb69 TaxID=1848650 RepID=UPI0030AF6C02